MQYALHIYANYSHPAHNFYTCPRHVCQACTDRAGLPVINQGKSAQISESLENAKPFQTNPKKLEIAKYTNNSIKLFHCLKCPAAYHNSDFCLPAGSFVDKALGLLLCPKHLDMKTSCSLRLGTTSYQKRSKHFNFCLECGKKSKVKEHLSLRHRNLTKPFQKQHRSRSSSSENDHDEPMAMTNENSPTKKKSRSSSNSNTNHDELYFCEFCPAAYHKFCLSKHKINVSGNSLVVCPRCLTGDNLHRNDQVWTRYGDLRWWPGRIILKDSSIKDHRKNGRLQEFQVQLYGTTDAVFVDRCRVYPYPLRTTGPNPNFNLERIGPSHIRQAFQLACLEARSELACLTKLKTEELQKYELDLLKKCDKSPPTYIKLKANKPFSKSVKCPAFDHDISAICQCHPEIENACAPGTTCINVVLKEECGKFCKAGKMCQNKNFVNRNYPKMKVYRARPITLREVVLPADTVFVTRCVITTEISLKSLNLIA